MRALMKGMTDAEFERQYGTEAQCFAALLAARQAAGMACPACGNTRIYVSGRRRRKRGAPFFVVNTAIADLSTAINATRVFQASWPRIDGQC